MSKQIKAPDKHLVLFEHMFEEKNYLKHIH